MTSFRARKEDDDDRIPPQLVLNDEDILSDDSKGDDRFPPRKILDYDVLPSENQEGGENIPPN